MIPTEFAPESAPRLYLAYFSARLNLRHMNSTIPTNCLSSCAVLTPLASRAAPHLPHLSSLPSSNRRYGRWVRSGLIAREFRPCWVFWETRATCRGLDRRRHSECVRGPSCPAQDPAVALRFGHGFSHSRSSILFSGCSSSYVAPVALFWWCGSTRLLLIGRVCQWCLNIRPPNGIDWAGHSRAVYGVIYKRYHPVIPRL